MEDILYEYEIIDYTEELLVIQENLIEILNSLSDLKDIVKNLINVNIILMFTLIGLIVGVFFIKGLFE